MQSTYWYEFNNSEDQSEEKEKEQDVEEVTATMANWDVIDTASLADPQCTSELAKNAAGQYVQNWKIEDPIMQYLATLSSSQRDKQVFTVASTEVVTVKGMENLRVVPALVNGVREEEALLDSGSQIVSMSRTAASECKLAWDPKLSINMMGANRTVSRTAGVARNVPFAFGNIIVHLQVHILEGAVLRP
jgi:hypothetical protein